MNASTATVDTPLRQAWPRFVCGQAGRLALRDLNILFQVCLGLLGLRMPRHRRLTISPASAGVARLIRRAADLAWRLGSFVTNRHE